MTVTNNSDVSRLSHENNGQLDLDKRISFAKESLKTKPIRSKSSDRSSKSRSSSSSSSSSESDKSKKYGYAKFLKKKEDYKFPPLYLDDSKTDQGKHIQVLSL